MYFLRATRPWTILSICECISGSPPGIETIGVPHSSTALKHSSGVNSLFSMCGGYWILPQPAQARLQRKSGSNINTKGYRLRPFSFCFKTYVATVHACEIGMGIVLHCNRHSVPGSTDLIVHVVQLPIMWNAKAISEVLGPPVYLSVL